MRKIRFNQQLILLLLSYAVCPVYAGTTPKFVENLWSVTINKVDQQEIALFLRDDADRVWVADESLKRWSLRVPSTAPRQYNGTTFYSLDGSEIRYQVNAKTQAISLEIPGNAFELNTQNVAQDSPIPVPSTLGGFINYDGTALHYAEYWDVNALTELGIFGRWGVGTTTFVGQNLNENSKFLRLDTTWTTDIPDRLASFRLGDAISQSGSWGQSARFGGIQWATNFATQPRFLAYPMPSIAGEAVLPSTVDVYVNNALQHQLNVPAGPFSINDLPMITGQGNMQIVVRDILGRERIINQPYDSSTELLKPGLHKYSYELGFLRRDYGKDNFNYGRALAAITHSYGFSEQLTSEVHTEILAKQQSAGIGLAQLWPGIGTWKLSVAGSHSDNTGFDSSTVLGFQHRSRVFNFSARTQWFGKNFAQLDDLPDRIAPSQITYVSGGLNFGRYGSSNIGYVRQNYRDERTNVEMLNAQYSLSLGSFGSLTFSWFGFINGESADVASLTFTTSLDTRTSASVHSSARKDQQEMQLRVQQNLPLEDGFAYHLLAGLGDDTARRQEAGITMQTQAGQYDLEVAHSDQQTAWRGNVRGGMAFMEGNARLSRFLSNSFALVNVPETPNARVFLDNQLVGTTDTDGNLLLTQLRPYDHNLVNVEPTDIALNGQILGGDLKLDAVPYFRSGYKLKFPIKYTHAALLTIKWPNGEPLPSGALVHIIGKTEEFPIALKGEAYITDLETHNRLHVQWDGQNCEFDLDFPKTKDPLPHLGEFTCQNVIHTQK